MRFSLLFAGCVSLCTLQSGVFADEMDKGAAPAVITENALEVPLSETATSKTIHFPSVTPKRDHALVLKFNSRFAIPNHGGYAHVMAIDVNGKPVTKFAANGSGRLLERDTTIKSSIEAPLDYWKYFGGKTALLLMYGPAGNEEIDPRLVSDREKGYSYTLDVSDLLNYRIVGADDRIEDGEENTLTFHFLLYNAISGGMGGAMEVKDIELCYVPQEELRKMANVEIREYHPTATVAAIEANAVKLDVTQNGGMVVTSGEERYYIESAFSYPAKPEMRYHDFTVGVVDEKGWNVTVEKSGDGIAIMGKATSYTVKREITPGEGYFAVKDTFCNTSSEDLGISWWNRVGTADLPTGGFRLAGQSFAAAVGFFSSSNPTVFVEDGKSSLGLVAEDTVSRAQLLMESRGNVLSLGSAGTGVAAGKSVSLDWKIYPGNADGYYSFINRVREDWGVNCTIPGPYLIIGDVVPGLKTSVMSVRPWLDYSPGGEPPSRENFKAEVLPQMEKMRKENPDVKLLGLVENNLVIFDGREYDWYEQLPIRHGDRNDPICKYGIFLDKELTQKLDAATPYKDSVIRNAEGCALVENYYTKAPYIHLMVQPEIGNHRFKTFLDQISFLMDDIGFDGVYIDQFQPYTIGGSSYDRWDGVTVKLDQEGNIADRCYNYSVTGAAARAAICKEIIGRGGIVITNGQPMSREEQNTGVIAFQEMENDSVDPRPYMDTKPPEFRWQTVSHLGTPVALGLRPRLYHNADEPVDLRAKILNKGYIIGLRNGVLFYYYQVDIPLEGPHAGGFGVGNNMFPFTPVAIGEGVMVGKERTITCLSGKYNVGGGKAPTILAFDDYGREKNSDSCTVNGKPGDWTVDVKLNDWNEIVIIVVND